MNTLLLELLMLLAPAVQSPAGATAPSAPAQQQPGEILAFVGATVHDPASKGAPAVATVIVADGKIREIGAGLAVPAGARTIECKGMHMIPGLIDGFCYLDPDHDILYVAAGVTCIRDHGNDLSTIFDQLDPAVRNRAPGPFVSTAGAVIDGLPPSTNSALVAQSEADIAAMLPKLSAEKVDFFAFQSNLAAEPWRKLITLAHADHKTVWGPVPKGGTLADVVAGAQDGLLFLDGFLAKDATWESFDPASVQAAATQMAAARTALVPLIYGVARLPETPEMRRAELELLSPQYVARWYADYAARKPLLDQPEYLQKYRVVREKQRALVKRLYEAKVRIVPGSGAPHPGFMPGDALLRELGELEASGIPARDVLRLATSGAAEVLGIADRGSLQPGKVADLVLLRADPEQSIANLAQIEGVCLRGRWLPRAELDASLAKLRAIQKAAAEVAAKPIAVGDPLLPEGKLLSRGYSETVSEGQRTAAEKWAVVEEKDGARTFVGRRITPGSQGHSDADVEILQRVAGGRLERFEIHLRTAAVGDRPAHDLSVRGTWVGGELAVERSLDGKAIDVEKTTELVAAVDVGSVTTFMLIASNEKRGVFPVLRFYAGLKLEVVPWQQEAQSDTQRLFRTPSGGKLAAFDALGTLMELAVQQGAGVSQTRTLEKDESGGGFPLVPVVPETVGPQPPEKPTGGG